LGAGDSRHAISGKIARRLIRRKSFARSLADRRTSARAVVFCRWRRFANAGAAKYAPLGEITEELYDSIFDINVKGLLFTVQKALPLLPDGASIVLNASIVGSKGFASNSVYSATKAAVRSFARTWTTDLKSRRIRVNAVSPGSTDTPGLNDLLASSPTGAERRKSIANGVPLGRLGAPDEVAKAVVFLASDDSSYITGIELFVDGGFAQV
jgi:NAD(P)-dependent dehydrogenase (short-subunit alcohol dehydrogenase family)